MPGTITAMQAAADKLAGANLGYDQNQRWTFLKSGTVVAGGETDCSSSCGAIIKLGGYPIDLAGTFYTGNFAARAKTAGFSVLKFASLAQVRPGDFLLTPGHHVVFVRSSSQFWSAEFDERGKSAGGRAGNQNGRETRYRAPYVRPGGWAYIVRPPADAKPATVSATVPLSFRAGFAAQEAPRFGGSKDYAARGRKIAQLRASVVGLTETLVTAKGEKPYAMRAGINKVLGSGWTRDVHPGGSICLFRVKAKYSRAGLKRSVSFAKGDPWHGALCVPLKRVDANTGLDVIVVHIRPKDVATDAEKRADLAQALTLVGAWPAVMMGDFAQDADEQMAAHGFVRISPDVDSYDPAGEQRIDAVYVQQGVLEGSNATMFDPGLIADHLWPAVTIARPTTTTL